MLRMSIIIYYYIASFRLGPRKRPYTRHLHATCMSLLRSATATIKHVEETATEILVLRDMLVIYSSFNRRAVELHPESTGS
jgi:hypothetical protein